MRIFLIFLAFALALALVPILGSRALVQDLFTVLCLLVLALNWNLLAGFAGLVSVGQQAFVGIGAYAMFACVILLGLNPILGMLVGGLVAMALSVPVAFFAFRLHGAYFAIGTWAVADIARLSFSQWKALGGGTGTALPKEAVQEMAVIQILRDLFGGSKAAAVDMLTYWLALALVLAVLAASWIFLRSRLGLGLQAVRDNPVAARAVGVDPTRLKALVFLLTAFVTGICGGLLFIQIGRISPDAAFSLLDWTAFVIFIVVIGGIGTLPGPIIGVLVFYGLERALADYGTLYLILLGLIGIAIMLFARRGLWGSFIQRTGFDPLPLGHRAPARATPE
ncbi:branched-chain amino acid ABC transporter permease [Xinfangfangia pollutisoli]|uniref:branched-chain amino acid ABC transporter permease n=1 Tax=Xinfangfangia pollutisoli TaxID=2865960 RepID=UPI001CD5566E|nr:branched-chain amino acid ABC transporter permease [Xinfangfangia pollutisoli]